MAENQSSADGQPGVGPVSSASVSHRPLAHKSWLEKALSVVTDVQPGEGVGVLLLTLDMFLLLASYYLLKTVVNRLF